MKRTNALETAASTSSKEAFTESIRTQYCGKTSRGHIKLVKDGVMMYGSGHLYKVTSSRLVEGKRRVKLNATPIQSTPDYESPCDDEENRIACVGQRSGREFRFIGTIVKKKRQPRTTQPQEDITPANPHACASDPTARNWLFDELRLIAVARNTGLDPSVKLDHVCALLHESRSSIYRKIAQCGFPPPIKRGRGSFWLMSQIEAYAAGNWGSSRNSESKSAVQPTR